MGWRTEGFRGGRGGCGRASSTEDGMAASARIVWKLEALAASVLERAAVASLLSMERTGGVGGVGP